MLQLYNEILPIITKQNCMEKVGSIQNTRFGCFHYFFLIQYNYLITHYVEEHSKFIKAEFCSAQFYAISSKPLTIVCLIPHACSKFFVNICPYCGYTYFY